MQVTGTCIIQQDGMSLRSKDGAKLAMGGKERTAVYADGLLLGPSEKPIASTVTATLAHTADSDLISINDAKNVTLTFLCDTGKRYVVRGAFCTKPCELTGGEGEVEVEFMGQPAAEV
jgi:hypothetical protein